METDFQPKMYFTEYGQLKDSNLKDSKIIKEPIKIEFSIQNPTNGSYSIQAKIYEDQVLDFFSGKKVAYVKQTLYFDEFFVCDFIFGKQQNIEITLKRNNKELKFAITLKELLSCNNSTAEIKYTGEESLIVKAEKLENYDDLLDVRFIIKDNDAQNNYFANNNNKLYYFITCNNKKIYKSSLISNIGTFENIYIPTNILQPEFTVSIYDSKNQLINYFQRSTKDIKAKYQLKINMPIINKNLYLEDNSEIIKNFSFVDYIQSGIKIALTIGIDFTRSNGDPFKLGTLHSIVGKDLNDYEKAILSCGKIVGEYDYDQLFPVFGFGAILNPSENNITSNCFNLNFLDNPEIKSIDNVLKVYRDCLKEKKFKFWGPTFFASLIRKAISLVHEDDLFEYHILMILTDGIIKDLQQTIDAIVDASFLPLSVIIIGIGSADFSDMNKLDGDEEPLVSSTGIKWKRDIVQFVPFSDYKNDPKQLAMEVLAEIPRQIVEYYRSKDLNPIQIKEKTSKSQIIPSNSLFIFNKDYFSDKNNEIKKGNISKLKNEQSTNSNSNYTQNIRDTNNSNFINNINIHLNKNFNIINEQNSQINNNSQISTTQKIFEQIQQQVENKNNQLGKTKTFPKKNDNDPGYSDRGDIYSQRNNINNSKNYNKSLSQNINGSQTQRNLKYKANPFHQNQGNNINQNLNNVMKNRDNNTINMNSINNSSNNNNINMINNDNMVSNFINSNNITINNMNDPQMMSGDFNYSQMSVHDSELLSQK